MWETPTEVIIPDIQLSHSHFVFYIYLITFMLKLVSDVAGKEEDFKGLPRKNVHLSLCFHYFSAVCLSVFTQSALTNSS